MIEASVELTVEFYDLDPMNVVWHGNYVRFFEAARCALLDKIGYNYNEMGESGFAFPVVRMNVKYIRPCVFRQRIRVCAKLVEFENFLRFRFEVRDAASETLLCKAETSQMAVDLKTRETLYTIPKILLEKIAAAQK